MEKNTNKKILYFGSFDAPYDTEVYICNTLEKLGCDIERRCPNTTSKEELKKLLSMQWDAVIFSKGKFQFNKNDLNNIIIPYSGKKIGWFWDLCWGTRREAMIFNHHLFKANIVFTSDGGDRDWEGVGINHKVLRQGIYEPEAVLGNFDEKYNYDIGFVGTNTHRDSFGWSERDTLLNFLTKTFKERFRHFGKDGKLRNLELNNLCASVKIIVGDSVYSPNYWSNRLYEIIGRGGFLIFPLIPGIEKEFIPGEHFIPYNYGDYIGLKRKIDYYLNHEKDREKIRLAGFEHCKKNHTYTIRCKELLTYI